MSDICVFRKELDGRFVNCRALRVTECPVKCSFHKSVSEYSQGQIEAENRLREKGLQVVIAERTNGERYMTTEKISRK